MTTLAYRAGIIAADSRETWESDSGGTSMALCAKLFRKRVGRNGNKRDIVIGTAGGSYLGMVFFDWYNGESSIDPPTILRDAHLEEDFDVIILDRGKVYTANHLCRPIEVVEPYIAVGSGRKGALAAMDCGRSAREAVRIAMKRDPFSGPPIVTMTMPGHRR